MPIRPLTMGVLHSGELFVHAWWKQGFREVSKHGPGFATEHRCNSVPEEYVRGLVIKLDSFRRPGP